MKHIHKIPAEITDALIYRKTTSAGSPDPSLPICEYNHQPQISTYSFFCTKKNRENPNPTISLYFQNTLFCIIVISIMLLSQLYLIIVTRKQMCLQDKLTEDCPWLSLKYNFFIIRGVYERIDNPIASKEYLDNIFLGSLIQMGVVFTLYPLSIVFIYFQARLLNQLRSRKQPAGTKACISDYTIMVTKRAEKGAGSNRKELEEYLNLILKEEVGDIPLEIKHYYCTTERTSYDYLKLGIKKINETIDYVKQRASQTPSDFADNEKKKLEKIIKNLEKNRKKLEGEANNQWVSFNLKSVPVDPPVDQREIFDQSMAWLSSLCQALS